MFSFENLSLPKDGSMVTVDEILNKVPEEILWGFYLKLNFKLGVAFKAPYRIDNNPSFSIFRKNGKLFGKDFRGDFYGDVIDYVMFLYGLNLQEALYKINLDFNLGFYFPLSYSKNQYIEVCKPLRHYSGRVNTLTSSTTNKQVQIISRPFTKKDLAYWQQYNINIEILNKFNVYSCKKVFLNKNLFTTDDREEFIFCYYFPITNHCKIYFPSREEYRFLSNTDNLKDIQGYYQVDLKNINKKNNHLILTKSMKDIMTLYSFNKESMAIHGEGHQFNPLFIDHLKRHRNNISSLYDRDFSGFKGARKLFKDFKIPFDFINKKFKTKDISDLNKNYGPEITSNFIQTL